MDCALELLIGCLLAFRNEEHVRTAAGYNAIVVVVMLWQEGAKSVGVCSSAQMLAKESLRKIQTGCPCVFKQCSVHVDRAIRSWPTTVKKKPKEVMARKDIFKKLFNMIASDVVKVGSMSEVIARMCVYICILSTENIPCGRFKTNSVPEQSHRSHRLSQIANRMDEIIREEARKIQIDTEDEVQRRLQEAFSKHFGTTDEPFDTKVIAEQVIDRMMGRLKGENAMNFSVCCLKEVDKKKKKGQVVVTFVTSPYTKGEDGEEFVCAKVLNGGLVEISLPHVSNSIRNPLFCPIAAAYVRDYWLNRVGLWCETIIDTINLAIDARAFSCNNSCEGFISGQKNTVSTVDDDSSSIADWAYRQYHTSEGMAMLLSNQMGEANDRISSKRNRVDISSDGSDEMSGDNALYSNMEWKRNSGTTRHHLKHYRDLMMQGLQGGRDKGAFNFSTTSKSSMWSVLNQHAHNQGLNFMSITTFREWMDGKRKSLLEKDWSDVIDDFYTTYGR